MREDSLANLSFLWTESGLWHTCRSLFLDERNDRRYPKIVNLTRYRRCLVRMHAQVANSHGLSPAQVVLKWHLQRGLTPIVKTTSARRLEENLVIAASFELTASELEILESLDRRASCDFTGFTSPDRIAWRKAWLEELELILIDGLDLQRTELSCSMSVMVRIANTWSALLT